MCDSKRQSASRPGPTDKKGEQAEHSFALRLAKRFRASVQYCGGLTEKAKGMLSNTFLLAQAVHLGSGSGGKGGKRKRAEILYGVAGSTLKAGSNFFLDQITLFRREKSGLGWPSHVSGSASVMAAAVETRTQAVLTGRKI